MDERRHRSRMPLKLMLTFIMLASALWLFELYQHATWDKIRSFLLGYFLGSLVIEWVHQRASRALSS
jgi:thiol:disulfide interchange protein